MSDNEIYLLIKYVKSVLWRVAKRLSYIGVARCLKVNVNEISSFCCVVNYIFSLLSQSLKWLIEAETCSYVLLNVHVIKFCVRLCYTTIYENPYLRLEKVWNF